MDEKYDFSHMSTPNEALLKKEIINMSAQGPGYCTSTLTITPTQCIPPPNSLRSFDDTLPRKQLRDHKVTHILVGPVRKMRSNTGDQGDIEDAPK